MLEGETDHMIGFECDRTHGYECRTTLFPLSDVGNYEKHVPDEWINEEGNDVLEGFIDYAMPLIQGETPMK